MGSRVETARPTPPAESGAPRPEAAGTAAPPQKWHHGEQPFRPNPDSQEGNPWRLLGGAGDGASSEPLGRCRSAAVPLLRWRRSASTAHAVLNGAGAVPGDHLGLPSRGKVLDEAL